MYTFSFNSLPWNIVFGAGKLNSLLSELDKLNLSRPLILSTPGQIELAHKVRDQLSSVDAELFPHAAMHVPENVVVRAHELVKTHKSDCTIAIGGGSTTGLGKILALKNRLSNIAIPTTYSGSEMTNIWGMTSKGRKVTGRDIRVLPDLTIYDPELTINLPPKISGPSGINALAQAVVNITAETPNPFVSLWAEQAVRAISNSLPKVVKQPHDIDARGEMLFGASLAGATLGVGITGLHHRLCHTLGGSYGMPHAETHTIILPHTVAFNASSVPTQTKILANALSTTNAAEAIFDLAERVDAPTSLKEIGFSKSDLEEAARISLESPINNPRNINESDIRNILEDAYFGKRPSCPF